MEEFARWILPIIGSALITTIIGSIVKKSFEKYFKRREADDARREEERAELMRRREEERERLQAEKDARQRAEFERLITDTLAAATKILNEKIDHIQEDIALDKAATITSLRAIMKQLRDQYLKQGYADTGDVSTWNELFRNYEAMGGNFFKDYVNSWKEDVHNLPKTKPERKISKARVNKKAIQEKQASDTTSNTD